MRSDDQTATPLRPAAAQGVGVVAEQAGSDAAADAMVDPDEARALVRYVARHGIDKDAAVAGPLAQAIAELETSADPVARADKTRQLIEQYGKLTALTYPTFGVNGRTVLDSEALSTTRKKVAWFSIKPVFAKSLAWLIVTFALAVLTEAMQIYYAPASVPVADAVPAVTPTAAEAGVPASATGTVASEGASVVVADAAEPATAAAVGPGWIQATLETSWVKDLYRLVLLYLQPFFWGAVGASVYLLKHTGDLVAARKFERQRQQGVSTRVILGGVFGAVIVHLFFGRIAGTDPVADLGPSAVAFLSGLGIRAIYAGFERVVDSLTDWVSGLGKAKPQPGQGGQ